MSKHDVDHPEHYNSHPSGVECIDLSEHMLFNLGNAFKYIFRCNHKGQTKHDWEKALWYILREQERSENMEDTMFEDHLDLKFQDLLAGEEDHTVKKLFELLWKAEFGGEEYADQKGYLEDIVKILTTKLESLSPCE
jgi:hypothetical protein